MKKKVNSLIFLLFSTTVLLSQNDTNVYDLIDISVLPRLKQNKYTLSNYILTNYYQKRPEDYQITLEGVWTFSFILRKDKTVSDIVCIENNLGESRTKTVKEIISSLKFKSVAFRNRKPVNTRIILKLEFGKFD